MCDLGASVAGHRRGAMSEEVEGRLAPFAAQLTPVAEARRAS